MFSSRKRNVSIFVGGKAELVSIATPQNGDAEVILDARVLDGGVR